ncbi:leucine--tRNA ligase [Candidatus Pacearchaeota archaeon RBG_19FT_COMBO_34_9]|nr:MAG: leucine--tRNA ligase [Candidatus Pacearchaeota archaeon RBG_19FT_COMBO_34_9]OGJ16545.1 MAG: leucine--tRNA ligase [Candidatus Pacearchaeota archaeon RBG_13_33_26]
MKFREIEKKWQKKWEEKKIFEVKENPKKKKFYVLDMFPYPSGAGLHMGHAFVFSLGDIFARFKRMQGFNVLYPIGYDALGLPAENAAIKAGTHPKDYTKNSIKNFMRQQKAMGWSYDWSRMINSSDPEYYKWDQWIFLKMLEKGIAYRKKAPVNWCSKCETVLANEQVVNGKCWRHEDTDVEIRHLEQWFFRITDYADELINGLDKLGWPENAKKLQRNWIGKSHGTEIDFEINGKNWPIFTTRPDTIFGVTFMVISAQHSRLMELVTKEQKKEVDKFLKKIKTVSKKSMKEVEELEKEGAFTGSYAVNPMNGNKIPIYTGNFVLADYGSGMIMAVPGHDQRDFEFADKYEIPVKVVIQSKEADLSPERMTEAYTGTGKLVNSGNFDGLSNEEAKEHISIYLKEKKLGRKVVNYKLRDWLISRQRYWGTPIPVIYCDKCGIVPEKELPVKLPEKVKFGKGNPLATAENWIKTKCPRCGGKGRRETDTMDTFANSSWYYLRYTDSKNDKKIFDVKKTNYWCPIDQYIGGPEHITMHLIYIRFYTKFLRDLGLLKFDEPALRYFTQGIVHGSDGEKMSKSKGNVIEPFDMINKYGADTLRLALVSFASPDKDTNWDEKIVMGSYKFLNKVFDFFSEIKFSKPDRKTESKLNRIIKELTDDVEDFRHNLAVIKIRQLFDFLADNGADKKIAESFLKMLHIYCPYLTEELWGKLGNKTFISFEKWPVADEKKIDKKLEEQEKAVENLISDINNVLKIVGSKNKVFIYTLPNEKQFYSGSAILIKKKTNLDAEIYAVNDKEKYDPENKSKKAKPGKPAIFLK